MKTIGLSVALLLSASSAFVEGFPPKIDPLAVAFAH